MIDWNRLARELGAVPSKEKMRYIILGQLGASAAAAFIPKPAVGVIAVVVAFIPTFLLNEVSDVRWYEEGRRGVFKYVELIAFILMLSLFILYIAVDLATNLPA